MKKLMILFLFVLIGCTNNVSKWKDGIIQYKYDDYFSENEKIIIQDAMNAWETSTGIITFKEAEKGFWHPLLIKRINKNFCCATRGFGHNYENHLKLGNCFKISEVKHELGHVIGLIHEHQRIDRDDYIKVYWNNIKKNAINEFTLETTDLYDVTRISYDYNSIMHYTIYEFSKNKIEPVLNSVIDINQRLGGNEITESDIKKVQAIYGILKEEISITKQKDFELDTIDDEEEILIDTIDDEEEINTINEEETI